jgi:septal ring factor EnvC (AmiA/AmiB activator)
MLRLSAGSRPVPGLATTVALAFALAAAAAILLPAPAAAQEGPEATQRFLKTIENATRSIREAQDQVQKTVDVYNSIINMTAKDTKDAYKDLGKQVAECDKKVTNISPKVDEMNAEAATYFAGRKAATASISDPDLRKRGDQRLADSQAQLAKIAAAGRDTRQTFEGMMTEIKDQSAFLGHDLNPTAIAGLKNDAVKLNDHAKTTLSKIDAVAKMYDEYVSSMRP